MTPYRLVIYGRLFGGNCCLQLQDSQKVILYFFDYPEDISKFHEQNTNQHSALAHERLIFIGSTMENSRHLFLVFQF